MTEKTLKEKKIAVLMGGKSSERDISLKSGTAILSSLIRSGFTAVGIDVNDAVGQQLKKDDIQIAFIALHGRWGEDGVIQGLLEMLGIPYTGSGIFGSAAAMDKVAMKMILNGIGMPTPDYRVVKKGETANFPTPFIVKPAHEGSTIGISIVREERSSRNALKEAFRYDGKVLLEKYIKGQEITVGIVNGTPLPIVEVRPLSGFYDYTSKYTKGMTEYIVPAPIRPVVAEKATKIALRIYDVFELSGCVRTDMIVNRGIPYVIDINTSPGMTETSLVPKAWAHLGRNFDSLIKEILRGASLKV